MINNCYRTPVAECEGDQILQHVVISYFAISVRSSEYLIQSSKDLNTETRLKYWSADKYSLFGTWRNANHGNLQLSQPYDVGIKVIKDDDPSIKEQ
jgi:hypothetical protein